MVKDTMARTIPMLHQARPTVIPYDEAEAFWTVRLSNEGSGRLHRRTICRCVDRVNARRNVAEDTAPVGRHSDAVSGCRLPRRGYPPAPLCPSLTSTAPWRAAKMTACKREWTPSLKRMLAA